MSSNTKVDPKVLEALVCPQSKTTLQYNSDTNELISIAANCAYPIRDGIPMLVSAEARPLDELEVAKWKR